VKNLKIKTALSILAILMALLVFFTKQIPKIGEDITNFSFGIGIWVWLMSYLIILIGNSIAASKSE